MISSRLSALLFAGALALASLGGAVHAQDKVLSDQILPRETFLYVSIPSVERMKGAMEHSSAGSLFNDPEMDAFKKEITEAFSEEISEGFAQVQDALGLSVDELLAIPNGEVTLAICSGRGNRMGAVIFFDYGEHEEEVRSLLGKASQALEQHGDSLNPEDVEYDGTELTMFRVTAPIAKQTPLAREFGWFLKDERLVISNSQAILETVLDSWDGDSTESLQSNNVYAYIMDKCETSERSSLMTMYIDPIGLYSKLVQTNSLGEASMGASMALGFFPMLGVDQLKAVGSVVQMDVDDFESVSRTFVYADLPPRGLMRAFQLDNVSPTPPAWVKEGVSLYSTATWKIEEAYSAVEELVDGFQGPGALAKVLDDLSERGPGVHIKTDVIDLLDGSITVVMSPGDSISGGTANDQVLIALGVRDEGKANDLLTKLANSPGFPGKSRELEGSTVYEIQNPGSGQTIGFTVADSRLMIGIGGTLLDQTLRNNDDVRPLADSDEFRSIAKYIPSNALAVSFAQPAQQWRSLYESVRSGDAVDNFPGLDNVFEKIDFSTLPPFEVIEKYMSPAGSFWVADEHGAMGENFSLKPAAR